MESWKLIKSKSVGDRPTTAFCISLVLSLLLRGVYVMEVDLVRWIGMMEVYWRMVLLISA